ncbi:amino acid aminotransferase [Azospirillum thermophilum]|uniref:Aromatic amino acid aminotransferase n=1 Tax=Azospirillum thermophilum TaxID=2202148 RepID=A0A2S2CUI0_9PROT|nr:amino acid aminotransferase [Azospirillum thermophilum]AWK88161.1 aromatic amino acid aminotransferase [Azospirillum thermophilum]
MFDALSRQPDDALLALIGLYNQDSRPGKVDLGVGVYRDEAGRTPVFRAVKAAERLLLESQDSKAYIGLEGDTLYLERLWNLVGGAAGRRVVAAGVQTPGGSGALRLAADLLLRGGCRRILVGTPTWPNHVGIFGAAGLTVSSHPFFDAAGQTVLFDRMVEALEAAGPGDAALLHGSCHNPTGAPLSADQWAVLAATLEKRGVLPLVDLAYQGFGRGLEEDAAGLRHLIAAVPETLVAVSSSKSFGLYRERTGAIFAVSASADAAALARSNLMALARTSYSMPPDHGAAVVRTILGDEALTRDWREELEGMRARIVGLRRALAAGLAPVWPALSAIEGQEGMFSLLPLTEAEVLRLRAEHAIYMPTSGRINIAGLKTADVAEVVARFAALR